MLISQKRLVVVIDERKKSVIVVKGLWQQLLALLLTYSPSYLSARQRTPPPTGCWRHFYLLLYRQNRNFDGLFKLVKIIWGCNLCSKPLVYRPIKKKHVETFKMFPWKSSMCGQNFTVRKNYKKGKKAKANRIVLFSRQKIMLDNF